MDYRKWLQSHSLKGKKWVPAGTPTPAIKAGVTDTGVPGGQGSTPSAGGQGPVTPAYSGPITGPDETYKDSTYYGNQSNIQTGLNNLGGYLNQAGIGLGAEYGVDTGGTDVTHYDPAHPPAFNVDWQNVDVTNPFSRAALLVKSHKANERGNTNTMASRGQLYSGALQNAQNTEGQNYAGGQDALLKAFAQQYGGLYGQYAQGQQTAIGQGIQNTGEAIDRHQNDPATPPPISSDLQDFFQNNSIVGGKWVAGSPNTTGKPKPASAPVADYKKWLQTHRLKGGKWVAK